MPNRKRTDVGRGDLAAIEAAFRFYELDRELRAGAGSPTDNPAAWIRKVLQRDLWAGQEEIVESVFANRRTTVRSAHAVGKTCSSACAALAFLYSYADAVVVTTAPTDRQVRRLLWGEIRAMHGRSGLAGNLLQQELRITEENYAFGFTAKDAESFAGIHAPHLLIIVDEASGVPAEIEDAAESLMASGDSHLLLIGNPTQPNGWFFDSHHGKRALYNPLHVSALDSPNFIEPGSRPYLVGRTYVEDMRKSVGEESPIYQVRVLGEFPRHAFDALFSLEWLEDAEDIHFPEDQGPVVAGLDLARYGDAENSLYLRKGREIVEHWEWYGVDTMETVGRALRCLDDISAEKKLPHLDQFFVDSIGIGAGPYDRLAELNIPVEEFVAGERAYEPGQYFNRRAEAYWEARLKLKDGQVGNLTDEKTVQQMASQQYKIQSDRTIRLESKEEMRHRGLPSPDRADALVMCLQEPLARPSVVWSR